MTLEQLTQSIALQWGVNDDYASLERIKLRIISARATVIQRRYDQTKIFPQSVIMTLKCQDIIKVSADECDCYSECGFIWRSKNKISKPLIVKDDSYFNFVGDIKGIVSYSNLRPEEVQDIEYRKFSSKQKYYTYNNEYLYFPQPLAGFTARYVPENPLDLLGVGSCSGVCIEDGELIIENSMEDAIIRLMDRDRPISNEDNTKEINIDANN